MLKRIALLQLLIVLSVPAIADSLTLGNINGLKYDRLGRFIGGDNISAHATYELTSRGTSTVFLLASCGGGFQSVTSLAVTRGAGDLTFKGSLNDNCRPPFQVRWGH